MVATGPIGPALPQYHLCTALQTTKCTCPLCVTGVYLTMRALLQPGDKVVAMFPCYQSLHEIADSIGCVVQPWQPHRAADTGRLEFRLQDVLVRRELLCEQQSTGQLLDHPALRWYGPRKIRPDTNKQTTE